MAVKLKIEIDSCVPFGNWWSIQLTVNMCRQRHVSSSNIYATRAAPTIPQRSLEGPNQPTSEFSAPI